MELHNIVNILMLFLRQRDQILQKGEFVAIMEVQNKACTYARFGIKVLVTKSLSDETLKRIHDILIDLKKSREDSTLNQ
jgi:hypothetical protein